jgi:hypothetical protein
MDMAIWPEWWRLPARAAARGSWSDFWNPENTCLQRRVDVLGGVRGVGVDMSIGSTRARGDGQRVSR